MAGADLLRTRRSSRDELASFNGLLSWCDLLNRPLFSCLGRISDYINPGCIMVGIVFDCILAEVALNLSLWPLWFVDVTRPWWVCLPATDASCSFGFGLSVATRCPNLVRNFAAIVEGRISSHSSCSCNGGSRRTIARRGGHPFAIRA